MEKYQCITCLLDKEENEFYRRVNGKRYTECKSCCVKRGENNRKKQVLKLRKQIFSFYGDKCSCCGESNYKFLTIDHINNNGGAHKRSIGNGRKAPTIMFYRWIVKNNFPDDLRLLCWNCNCGRSVNSGVCPHKEIECLQEN